MKDTLLQLYHINLNFSGREKNILSDISYPIKTGDFIIVLGSNGSGKSSLLKCLNKTYEATSGDILLHNNSIKNISENKLSRHVKMLTQNTHESLFTSMTVLENYLLVKQAHESNLLAINTKRARQFFAEYILKFNENLALKLDQPVYQLSGGEQQALALALTVIFPPEILLLDEHTSALDPHSADRLMKLTKQTLADGNITCLLTTHDLSIAQHYGNRILALRDGMIHQVFERDANEKFSHQQLLSTCY
jgi:putative ABC transport system ATP-binding protein